ncbi:hypothetical protein AA100600_0077 [Gluconobacter thailandicus F149-1 = NBRC 100600]|nr:hypothetical protein AA100600_0077 [Gluconobacter thailandicus F149-1 = NBRC 100600]
MVQITGSHGRKDLSAGDMLPKLNGHTHDAARRRCKHIHLMVRHSDNLSWQHNVRRIPGGRNGGYNQALLKRAAISDNDTAILPRQHGRVRRSHMRWSKQTSSQKET